MTATKHLPGLDLLRAVAILLVLTYHISVFFHHPAALSAWASFGWTGVDLFFVLSGYLISSQLLAARELGRIDLTAYFLKRGFRILPAYWLMVAVYFLFPSWSEIPSPAPLWKFLSFTQNLGLDTARHRGFSHAWSLCIEEQFYFALPLLLVVAKRRLKLPFWVGSVVALMLAGLVVRWLSWVALVQPHLGLDSGNVANGFQAWSKWIYYPTPCRLDGLLTGVLIAGVFHWRPDFRTWTDRHPGLFLLAGASLLGLGWKLGTPMTRFSCAIAGYPILSYAYGAFLISALSPSFGRSVLLGPTIKWGATLSYAVYLSHKVAGHLLQAWLIRLGLTSDGWPMFVGLVAGCFLAGLGIHLVIERPSQWLRDLLLRRRLGPSNPLVEPVAPGLTLRQFRRALGGRIV